MPRETSKTLPAEVYVPFVQSLYADGHILVLGGLTQGATSLLVYANNGRLIYLLIALALIAAGLFRYASIRRRQNLQPLSVREARLWEIDYLVWGTVQGVLLGFYCFVALFLSQDSLAEIASLCVTLASAVAIVGRNYASNQMVLILASTMTLPISAGLMLRGDIYNVVLGLICIPFFIAIIKMSERVREAFLSVIFEKKKASGLALRFDRALNTMSSGLVMFGADGKVAVANGQAAGIFGMANPDRLFGRTLHALLMRGAVAGVLTRSDALYVEKQLTQSFHDGRGSKLVVGLKDGRYLEFSATGGRDDLGVLTFEDVTARVESEEQIRYMARFDSQTDLPNRAYFHEIVAEAQSRGNASRACALAVIDLDDFKTINDALGHPVGDGLIRTVAQRLATRSGDKVIVSRFGGDEFMVYFDELAGPDALKFEIDAILELMNEPVVFAGNTLHVRASIGAVVGRVCDLDVDVMMIKADLALYRAKERGKNQWQLFEAEMDAEFRHKQMLKADLLVAIQEKSLRLVYQPIVALDTMRISGCEALCRWNHRELGPISPAVFIPLAEEMGIISKISAFVLEAATAECVKWPSQLDVSVNLSAKDLRDRSVVDVVKSALQRSHLEPARLEIELTETALLDDKNSTRQVLEELKSLGVRIALDDFGTGYSSLSYLHKLPLDKVKIDRSFIEDLTTSVRSQKQLKGVVDLSRSLGMQVTIEGVETFDQLKLLAQDINPDLIQGFLFGAALSASGIETMSNTVWPFADEIAEARAVSEGRTRASESRPR